MNLEKLTVRELVDLYNKHSGKAPIRAFRDKATAVKRVRAVLPTEATQASGEPAIYLDVSMFEGDGISVDALAAHLGVPSGRKARAYIDRARRAGHNIVNVDRGVFALK